MQATCNNSSTIPNANQDNYSEISPAIEAELKKIEKCSEIIDASWTFEVKLYEHNVHQSPSCPCFHNSSSKQTTMNSDASSDSDGNDNGDVDNVGGGGDVNERGGGQQENEDVNKNSCEFDARIFPYHPECYRLLDMYLGLSKPFPYDIGGTENLLDEIRDYRHHRQEMVVSVN